MGEADSFFASSAAASLSWAFFFGSAFFGLFANAGIGIIPASPKNFATLSVGLAPFAIHSFIDSEFNCTRSLLSFCKRGLYRPTFSINFPSRGLLESATTTL